MTSQGLTRESHNYGSTSSCESSSIQTTSKSAGPEIAIQEVPFIDLASNLSVEEASIRSRRVSFQVGKFLWDALDKHPKEQSFLLKLDWFLLSSAMLGYFIKTLNASNVSLAYMNGMKDYYGMHNNEYNYMVSAFTAGYLLGAVPASYLLHRVNLRVFIASLEIIWTLLTLLMVLCGPDQIVQMYIIRFFVGLLTAPYFPTVSYIIGCWYSPEEMTKRSSLFYVSSGVAAIVGGPLQEALLQKFQHSSLEPFKCMFIFEAIISIPIAIYTFYTNPGTPSTTDSWYFSDEDKMISLERKRRATILSRRPSTTSVVRLASKSNSYREIFSTWHIYVFPLVFLCYQHSGWAIDQPTFQSWMKYDLDLPSSKYNFYPSILSTLGMCCALFCSFANDFFGQGETNHRFVLAYFTFSIFGSSLLLKWDIPRWLHWCAYFIVGVPQSSPPPLIFSWVNKSLLAEEHASDHSNDNGFKRGTLIFATNSLAYVSGAWVQIFVWNAADAPKYHLGFLFTVIISSFGIGFTLVAWYLDNADKKKSDFDEPTDVFSTSSTSLLA